MLGSCNTANYNSAADWNGIDGNVSTVGSNGKPSYYGTYDQTGNINELLDTNNGNWKIIRGGSFLSTSLFIDKSYTDTNTIDLKRTDLGFRIAKTSSIIDSTNYVLVENISNTSDTNSIGSVGYTYQIKKYPITNSEYTEFLNAVCSTSNTLGLWVTEMADAAQRGGINRSGIAGSYSYTVKTNMGNKPVNFINWFSAARYINWLHNNKPSGSPSNSTTETGVYTLVGFVVSGSSKPSRNNTNSYWLPNENEWYKAAYYDPTKNGSGGYWSYATVSDSLPDSILADSTGTGYDTSNPNNCVTPTPTPTISITPTNTPSLSLSATPTVTPTISVTVTATPTISITASRTNTPSITVTKSPTRTRQATPTVTPTISVTRTSTMSPTPTRTPTRTVSSTPTITPTPSKSMVLPIRVGQLIYQNGVYANDTIQIIYKGFNLQGQLIPNASVMYEIPNASPTPTPTVTPTTTITSTPTLTVTNTITPSITITITPTNTVSSTPTNTPTISITPDVTVTPTVSITPSITVSVSPTPSITSSVTPSITPSITTSVSPTVTQSITPSITVSVSPTITPSITSSITPSITPTTSITPTITPTPTLSSVVPSTDLLAVAFNSNKNAQSTDSGNTWTLNNMPTTKYWTSVVFDNSQYVVCAYNESNIYTSNDGVLWTANSISSFLNSNHLWVNIIYGNGIFIVTPNSSSIIGRSTDGINWTEISLPAISNWKGGAYGNGLFVIAAENSTVSATSANGITWTQRVLPASAGWNNIEYLNTNFFIVGANNNILLQSSNGIAWTSLTLPSINSWSSIAYGNGVYVILSSDGTTLRSTDLVTWNTSSLVSGSWSKIFYRNNFIAIGNNLAYTSSDGITWTQRTIGNYNWFDMA
jgi:photosystem II stability/assembly factor-like uncharacterized protein